MPNNIYWLNTTPLPVIGLGLLACMLVAGAIGMVLQGYLRRSAAAAGHEAPKGDGHVTASIFGLLALLMGFTLSMAVDRFDARRQTVLEEANAIGTAYLRTQLLPAPHRERISHLLVAYVDNRIALANAGPGKAGEQLKVNDQLLTDLWSATAAAFDDVKGLDFSSAYVESMNSLIDMDTSRKVARQAHVPDEVFAVLFIYIIVTAAMLGCVQEGVRGRASAAFLMVLFVLALLLILDIDRPTLGGIRESQAPMTALQASFRETPIVTYDRYRTAPSMAPLASKK